MTYPEIQSIYIGPGHGVLWEEGSKFLEACGLHDSRNGVADKKSQEAEVQVMHQYHDLNRHQTL